MRQQTLISIIPKKKYYSHVTYCARFCWMAEDIPSASEWEVCRCSGRSRAEKEHCEAGSDRGQSGSHTTLVSSAGRSLLSDCFKRRTPGVIFQPLEVDRERGVSPGRLRHGAGEHRGQHRAAQSPRRWAGDWVWQLLSAVQSGVLFLELYLLLFIICVQKNNPLYF